MDSIVKQRLVGALVLIAPATVFWPIIFVQAPEDESMQLASMPARPDFDRSPMATPTNRRLDIEAQLPNSPDQTALEASADAASMLVDVPDKSLDAVDQPTLRSAAALDPAVTRSAAPLVGTIDDQGLAIAWVLQVATVGSESRANELMAQFKTRGYPTFIEQTKRTGKVLYRVKVGPKVERAKLAAIKAEVDAWLDVDATLLRYVQ